jgi:transposase-like protein
MKMSKEKDRDKLQILAEELAKDIHTEEDLAALSRALLKLAVETALKAEMNKHLGYKKHDPKGHNSGNNRNGFSAKTLKGDIGEVEIETPRDRNGSFEPQLIRKGQRRLTKLDDHILALYARGMTTRDIAETFKEMYDVDVSHTLISQVTEAVLEEVQAWQNRPLDEVYPVVYLDGLRVKVHQDKRVIIKVIYLALGINLEGQKELLGLWLAENEGAKFWMAILTELQIRGIKDIFIACVDGLTGFSEAIETVFSKTTVQLCMVHLMRNSLNYVSWKDRKAVAQDLKAIYRSVTAEEAERALEEFAQKWDEKYPTISPSWRKNWERIIPLFAYPDEIRRVIYTTNAIESLGSVIRKAIRNRKIFPNDASALKVVYLAIQQASRKWTMPIHNWKEALNRFAIEYKGRLPV